MTNEKRELKIKRILVALDASEHSLAAMDAAVTLAARLEATVVGLFVEDENLLQMADLPCTRQVGAFSAVVRDFNRNDVERELRAQAALAERALAAAAERARVSFTFHVRRGIVTAEVLAAATEADLITLGRLGWTHTGWRAVGSTAAAVLEQTCCPVLVLHRDTYLALPFVAVYDGTDVSRAVVGTAASLAEAMDGFVCVLVLDDRSGAVDGLAKEVSTLLDDLGIPSRLRRLSGTDPHLIVNAVHSEEGCGVLVLPAESPWLTGDRLRKITRDVARPVLLIRTANEPDAEDEAATEDEAVAEDETATEDEAVAEDEATTENEAAAEDEAVGAKAATVGAEAPSTAA